MNISDLFAGLYHVFTDRSKQKNDVGAGFYISDTEKMMSFKLLDECSSIRQNIGHKFSSEMVEAP